MRYGKVMIFTALLALVYGSAATAVAYGDTPASADSASRHGFVDLPSLGGSLSYAWGINERGEVAGASETEGGRFHATLWRRGEPVDLGALDVSGFDTSVAEDINNRGDVVGYSFAADGTTHAILWRDGTMIDLGLGGEASSASKVNERGEVLVTMVRFDGTTTTLLWRDGHVTDLGLYAGVDINDLGHVLGSTLDESGQVRPFIWRQGTIEYLPVPAGHTAYPIAMNNKQWVVYRVIDQTDISSAVLWHDGVFSELQGLGGPNPAVTVPLAINDRGEVIGYSVDPDKNWIHAVIWRHATMTDLDALGAPRETVLRALNNSGQAVGYYPTTENGEQAVLWR
jgi:probable HAF family extracellular repeat protein